ncbi:hypothetical protein LINGRAPRIM_LOCUS2603 [Linum grandiflorum]
MLEEEKPGCGVKSDPNIVSRCKLLKKRFLAVQELKNLSGAGWDEVRKMVVIDDTVYADYVAAAECEANFVDLEDEVPPTTPTYKGNQTDATTRPKKKRRTSITTENGDDDELKPLFKETVQTLKTLVGESVNQKTKRAQLVIEIAKIGGITRAQAVKAAYILAGDNQRMEVFFDLETEEERKEWIEVVLQG